MCLTFLNPTVFVYSSLAHSLSLSLWLCFYLCVYVVSGNCPHQAAGLSLFTEGSSLALGDKADRKWEFTLAYFTPKKKKKKKKAPCCRTCTVLVGTF